MTPDQIQTIALNTLFMYRMASGLSDQIGFEDDDQVKAQMAKLHTEFVTVFGYDPSKRDSP